jgi:hypothetical protein
MNPTAVIRADSVERALLMAASEHAAKYQRDRDKALARLIRNELADMESKRRRR